MRVISGFARGKKLYAPKDDAIRPTSDRVKESVFNILAFHLRECIFVDLFCGSGAMGIEAISRGSRKTYLFDRSKSSIQLAEKNLDHCGFDLDTYLIKQADYMEALDYLKANGIQADIMYLDPPYAMENQLGLLERIRELDLLAEDGIILLEYDMTDPPDLEGIHLEIYDQRKYGNTGILFLRNQVMT